jgi:GntR family transcriptional regulator, transcriptional repressor for pyruvate dehydrogenase complex
MSASSRQAPTLSLTRLPPRRKLAETVAEQVLAEIRRRGLTVGTRMPSERELMEALGVGRSTVREALNGLAMLGAIEIRHGQGAFVASEPAHAGTPEITAALAKGVTRDLLEARRPVETEIARLAALRRTPADLREIETVLERHEIALAAGRRTARWSARFHLMLAEAAHNEVLAGFVASFVKLLVERGPALEQLEGYREWELGEHRSLYEAVRDADPDLAAERMRAHLAQVEDKHARLAPSA